jgi:hypothetical protein
MRTQRFCGEKARWKRAKKKEPRQKERMEVRALIQRNPSWGAIMPRPRYIVFPGGVVVSHVSLVMR